MRSDHFMKMFRSTWRYEVTSLHETIETHKEVQGQMASKKLFRPTRTCEVRTLHETVQVYMEAQSQTASKYHPDLHEGKMSHNFIKLF